MVSVTVLARLLTPEDFGIVGFLASITIILALFRDMGLSSAIIQSKELARQQLNSLFLFTFGIGTTLFILVSLLGWIVSLTLSEPKISEISPYYGLIFLIDAIGVVPLALMRRNMRFRGVVIRDSLSAILGLGAGIAAAYNGAGYWALVIMTAVTSVAATAMTWIGAGWLPCWDFAPLSKIRHFLMYGGAFAGGQLANIVSENLDKLLIGKFFGMTELGFYTRAQILIQIPTTAFFGPIQSVFFPIMSRARRDTDSYHHSIMFWGKIMVFAFAIAAALVAAITTPLIGFVLGARWEASAPILKWLSLLIFARPLGSLVYLIMVTDGNMKVFSAWVWTNMLLTVSAIIVGLNWGPLGVAAALGLAGSVFGVPLALWFLERASNFRLSDFLLPYLLAGGVGLIWYYTLLEIVNRLITFSTGSFLQIIITASLSLIVIAAVILFQLRLRSKRQANT